MVSVESIEKKMLKKKKYAEISKEKQKREQEKQKKDQEKQQHIKTQVVCHFFVEGRCQKGDKCPFSHSIPLLQSQRKLEICKYYLNGFCAKAEKCMFMHSEFPCKFFHRINFATGQKKNQCMYGDQCRFSHEPITNPLIQEAYDKYLAESANGTSVNIHESTPNSGGPNASKKIPSLLGISESIPSLMDLPTGKKSTENPSSPPNPTSGIPSLLGVKVTKPNELCRDVDERVSDIMAKSGDVDERGPPITKTIG
jgi:hypothetical protein